MKADDVNARLQDATPSCMLGLKTPWCLHKCVQPLRRSAAQQRSALWRDAQFNLLPCGNGVSPSASDPEMIYPAVLDPNLVGTYDAVAKAGGGYVWDEVLEYRVWCHPERGAADEADGNDYYYVFVTYEEVLEFSRSNEGTEEPLALVLQREYIDEPSPGEYSHVREERIAEWPVSFLSRPRRTERTIPDFMDPNAPPNRLAILRGQE